MIYVEMIFMEYMTVTQAAEKWGIAVRTVRFYCEHGLIDGVIRHRKKYMIPVEV
ncbi:MAG: helix-turn-helix domain-containing protein [Acutalibacteraceae bacterium]